MDNQKENSEILFKATGQGYSIFIHGKREEDGSWKCSVEENEITFTEIPKHEHVASLGEKRDHEKTEFRYSFEEAFKKIDQTEWFLCHPGKLHTEFAEFVMSIFDQRMEEYNVDFPAETTMEKFLRENKIKEWKTKAGSN